MALTMRKAIIALLLATVAAVSLATAFDREASAQEDNNRTWGFLDSGTTLGFLD